MIVRDQLTPWQSLQAAATPIGSVAQNCGGELNLAPDIDPTHFHRRGKSCQEWRPFFSDRGW
ncbi:MAG: hypothetical protein HC910_05625 [Spirulinaceae cyanobacterium SM2_1_0]|nr:hypothetical protein [Spirulinaceae cyanobacterium SM2_1_0]